MLGRRIAARPRPPATVRDLEIALLEEWNSIPQSLIDNLITSMANSSPPGGATAYQLLHRSINRHAANLAVSPIFRYAFIESLL
ncbi:hypothetical protein TNCV_2889541 [Trichonephila clavipes]|nr:hypothetical protein TNCV_2889541 [Trichonephila clavipes]